MKGGKPMIYYEAKLALFLQKEIHCENTYEAISKFLSHVMLQDAFLKAYHEEKFQKNYVWDSLFPLEKDKLYKAGRIYMLHIRSLDLDFMLKLKKCFELSHDEVFKVMTCQLTNYPYKLITKLKSLTPVVCTLSDQKYWTREDGLKLLEERINICVLKKYRRYVGEMEENKDGFIESIRLLNEKSIAIPYKNTKIIGNKLEITCKSDDYSQKLAFTLLASGSEKCSLGFSYFIMDRG